MLKFLEIDHLDKVFNLPNGSQYIALKNIDLTINPGEFISLIGHSGCGKSTLLNLIAGLDRPSAGGVILEGKAINCPGPDRMVVFQNYSLLPWLTVRQNIALGVNRVLRHLPKRERRGIVESHIDLVKLRHASHKWPAQLSGGMRQRVAIARALAIRPKVLLLDEPFGALDALTRGGLQEQLMQICQKHQVTCVMVTHDVDEALLLSDRVVMLTNGPAARIGQVLEVPIPRPRDRHSVLNHPAYYSLRNEMLYFLEQQKRSKKHKRTPVTASADLEKVNLELGFIALNDSAPLLIAKEKNLFAKHGLDVNLSREPSWRAIAEGVAEGRLDAAPMVAGMPIALSLAPEPVPICTALTLSRNGNAVTISKQLYAQGVCSASRIKQFTENHPDQVTTFGVVHPASMQNLLLRHWLANSGIDPDQDVSILTIPPAQMVSNLKAGNIAGYCAGDPWNSRAVYENLGVILATSLDLWSGHPEKVLGVREDWAAQYPKTHVALVKALLEACAYCDDPRNRSEVAEILSQHLSTDLSYTRWGLVDAYDRGDGQEPEFLPRFFQFYTDQANCPDPTEHLWMLTQMARWGITPFPRNWVEVVDRLCQVEVFRQANAELNFPEQQRDRRAIRLFDELTFSPDDPLAYLHSLGIKRPIQINEALTTRE